MEIAILRHGMPEPISEKPITASDFIDWIRRYNESGLSKTSHPSQAASAYAQACNVIVSSTLPRSIDSAKTLDAEKLIISDKQFIEAGLPSANWRLLKMSPNIWAMIFRVLWLLGYANNSESLNEAKQRASQAADTLIQLAREQQKVLFVGHGIFNRLLAKELRNRDWSGPRSPGSTHWSFGVYKQLRSSDEAK
ncbi:MAG: histidine phosphatase family protein [Candidatus Electrothrix scaldis]|nr:MAG: histidine phosphatase family protein [Candidatus Electrothrix sp. GW3-3]